MGRLYKAFLFVIVIFSPFITIAQFNFNNNTNSPYSRFGLGDLQPAAFGRSNAMGDAILGSRASKHINFINPASYTSIDSMSFLFEIGFASKSVLRKDEFLTQKTNNTNFNYIALSFPVTRWFASTIGLSPYSDSGYDIEVTGEDELAGVYSINYYGGGSLSKAFIGFAIEPVKNISLGTNLYYFFGSLSGNSELRFLNSSEFETQKFRQFRLHDIALNYGVQVTLPLKNNKNITFGATLEAKPEFTAFRNEIQQKVLYTSSSTTVIDTIFHVDEQKNSIQMPLTYGLGLSYYEADKFEFNFDYFYQGWSEALIFGETLPELTNLTRISLGGEWIPDYTSIRSYLNRMAYRAGIKYEKTQLFINSEQITNFGISFGVGLPIYRSESTINISVELGKRGINRNGLIKENYARFALNANLHDIWFIKRKFD